MPPKRTAKEPAGGTAVKKSRTSASSATTADMASSSTSAPPASGSKRWAPVSNSGNVEASYKLLLTKEGNKVFDFECVCRCPFAEDEDDEYDSEDEEEENQDGNKDTCDNGKKCLCHKAGAAHPSHPWQFTRAGLRKWVDLRAMCDVRDPDTMGMHTFNDHSAYGTLEVIQNIMLDFEEALAADDGWGPMWAVTEAAVLFVASGRGSDMVMIDDGELATETFTLLGRMLVTALAQLERNGLLAADANGKVGNLPVIMALMLQVARDSRGCDMFDSDKTEPLLPKTLRKKWTPDEFDRWVLAYARKHDIKLVGPKKVDKLVAECDKDGVELPPPDSTDPFGWAAALKKYKTQHAGITGFFTSSFKPGTGSTWKGIGGDRLDITTWTSATRKKYAFDKKDPLGKAEMKKIADGDVLMLA